MADILPVNHTEEPSPIHHDFFCKQGGGEGEAEVEGSVVSDNSDVR